MALNGISWYLMAIIILFYAVEKCRWPWKSWGSQGGHWLKPARKPSWSTAGAVWEQLDPWNLEFQMTWLVVWHICMFPYILGISSSQLTFIFFRGVQIPNQWLSGGKIAVEWRFQVSFRPGDLSWSIANNKMVLRYQENTRKPPRKNNNVSNLKVFFLLSVELLRLEPGNQCY